MEGMKKTQFRVQCFLFNLKYLASENNSHGVPWTKSEGIHLEGLDPRDAISVHNAFNPTTLIKLPREVRVDETVCLIVGIDVHCDAVVHSCSDGDSGKSTINISQSSTINI